MPIPFAQRNPEAAKKVEEAYAAANNTELTEKLGKTALENTVSDEVEQAKDKGLINHELESITDIETKQAFQETIEQTKQLFGKLGIEIPTTSELANVGVDFVRLAGLYKEMEAQGLEPRLIIAPTIGLDNWKELYGVLSANMPSKFDGLSVDYEVKRGFDSVNIRLSSGAVPVFVAGDSEHPVEWSVRLIPASHHAPFQNVRLADSERPEPTVGEYLTVQALLMQAGQELLDDGLEHCRLQGEIPDAEWDEFPVLMGNSYTDSETGSRDIRISYDNPDYISLGLRPPVW